MAKPILLLTDSNAFAGTERHMLELACGLRDLGWSVQIAAPDDVPLAQRAAEKGIPTRAIEKRGLIDREAVKALVWALRSGEVQIIHAHNGRTALSAALAVWLARRGRCVVTQHFLEPDHTRKQGVKGTLFRLAHHWVDRHTHQVIAVSQAVQTAMERRGETHAPLAVVPNGLTVPATPLRPTADVRAAHGLAPETPLVVCVARLEPEKDVDILVDAMARVRSSLPQARCWIIGDGKQRPALERQIAEKGLSGIVQLLGYQTDALSFIAAADLFVLPSRAEPFGLVLLEAMALERPVIAVAAGGPAEIVRDGETGALVKPQNPDALAAEITKLLQAEPQRRRRFGQEGRKRFEARYSTQQMARATGEIYQRLFMR